MFDPIRPEGFAPNLTSSLDHLLMPLRDWARSPRAEADLEQVFGTSLSWPAAYKWLDSFRRSDFLELPPVRVLPSADMPGLWGGYSRDTREIFLSSDCPPDLVTPVLLEEIGHFLDQEICAEETPGDEGANFAALVLGDRTTPTQVADWAAEETLSPVYHLGRELLVEAAPKLRGNAKLRGNSKLRGKSASSSKTPPAAGKTLIAPNAPPDTITSQDGNVVYTAKESVRLIQTKAGQRVIGSRGNDTFVVSSQDVRLEDPNGGIDTVEAKVSFDLSKFSFIENLTATPGTAPVTLGGNSKANVIIGNDGANKLDGGADSASDTLVGGGGNDTYVIRDTLDVVIEAANGGTDTIATTINNYVLNFANVENVAYIGTGNSTLTGNSLANILTGGTLEDTLIGGSGITPADTLRGGQGDDVYLVSRQSDIIEEGSGPLDGIDTIQTSAATYSMANFANVEVLTYSGSAASRLTGNSGNNIINGGRLVRNTIDGGAGDDYLIGGNTTDSLFGGVGNDTLVANLWLDTPVGALGTALQTGGGSDTLNGGAGDDWYVVNSQTAYTFVDSSGKDTIASTVSFSLKYNKNISDNIENLYLIGKDSLSATGSDSANTITGNDGNNVISAGGGNDTVYGGLGGDFINGESGNDTIFGGGQPQTDLPADASTAITIRSGESYTGKIDFRRDTDWIRAELFQGITYTFELTFTPLGNDALKKFSDAGFGEVGYDYISDPTNIPFRPCIADFNAGLLSAALGREEFFHRDDHGNLVLNEAGNRADGAINYLYDYLPPEIGGRFVNRNENLIRFEFTPFSTGEFYIPISGAGPLGGEYMVTLNDPETSSVELTSVLADDGSNTLVGGVGKDFLVSGNGRDSLGAAIGDILLGGTNGVPGGIDQDTISGQNSDTLIGGDGGDLLDGGKGIDTMVGGGGNDTYFIDSSSDLVVEEDDGGQADLGIFSYAAARNFSQDLGNGLFALTSPALDSVTGAGFDVDLANDFPNVEHASLMGSANLYVLGNGDPNSLYGNFGNNLLVGANGDDSLFGQGGNDYLVGGDGGDLLDGGSGQNTMDGGLGSDTYIVNDRNDRILNEIAGLDGGMDLVRTYFNFDPIQGSSLEQFQPDQPDNSTSVTKSISFASRDLSSFINLENFELLGQAAYGVGNALNNSMTASEGVAALLLGMGGEDTLLGGAGGDTLYGDTPDFYASPDLYAAAPADTRTQAFVDGVIGSAASDYLDGGDGDNYLDGGSGFDTMIGGNGNDTFVQDNTEDYIVAGGGANELISSVKIAQAPDDISKLMLVVAKQAADSGQSEVASFGSFLGTKGGNNRTISIETGNISLSLENANTLEVMYAPRPGQVFANEGGVTPLGASSLLVGTQEDDLNNPGKIQFDLSWTSGPNAGTDVVGYTVRYKRSDIDDIWHTYVNGKSQDFQGTQTNPVLTVSNLQDGTYDFQVTAIELTIPALQDLSSAQHVTLQGGAGNDAVIGLRLTRDLAGGLADDRYTDPLIQNNPNFNLPLGFIFNPAPYDPTVDMPNRFATYLDGGFGNDILNGDFVNDRSGDDYVFQGITFKGLNTLVGGQGSDTFVVKNGGNAIGDEFDWVVKYGNETPVDYGSGGVGASLNGGQHNLVVSRVDYLTLSDTIVHQGKFIDQLALARSGQFGMGNRLDNFIYDGSPSTGNTLVGNTGRDSIVGYGINNVLIGGTAYGLDNVGFAIKDFAFVADGGNGLTNSIFRDTDPLPAALNGPGAADPSQFWFVPGYYGAVFDPARNRDTLVANDLSILDGGAGHDSLVGSSGGGKKGDNFYVSAGYGGMFSQNIIYGDAVFGNGGNDTVTFTDSDYLWWSGHEEGAILANNGYTIAGDISNLVLQMGAPTARNGTGNKSSTGNDHDGWFEEIGSNLIVGNEFDNILDGGGVGGDGNVGGFDTLTGMGGSDLFVISGYRGASNNKWEPSITDFTDGPNAGQSLWDSSKSEYTDADFVLVTDFTPGQDFLALPGAPTDYWIGAAPTGFSTKNVSPLTGTATPAGDSFGIYRSASYGSGTPDLVAHIRTSGGVELDLASLQLAYTPAGSAQIPTGNKGSQYLGWGKFYELDSALFDDGSAVNASLETTANFQSAIQTSSTASLSALMGQIV